MLESPGCERAGILSSPALVDIGDFTFEGCSCNLRHVYIICVSVTRPVKIEIPRSGQNDRPPAGRFRFGASGNSDPASARLHSNEFSVVIPSGTTSAITAILTSFSLEFFHNGHRLPVLLLRDRPAFPFSGDMPYQRGRAGARGLHRTQLWSARSLIH
jgi:hypothetical protein